MQTALNVRKMCTVYSSNRICTKQFFSIVMFEVLVESCVVQSTFIVNTNRLVKM